MDLRNYEQQKFAIAEVLRSAHASVPEDTPDLRARFQELFARLAEDRFNLAVVGRFSRGKTTLMNAILGMDRLPTGITPLTSVITTVGYGSMERVVLQYHDRIFTTEVSIDELPKYITQQGNPGNIQRIKIAEVQLPAEILRRGFYFVDTPGLGSVIVENTLTTEAFLPEADAFVLVTSYESPLSDEEVRFFKAASASRRRIFTVLNKHDTVSWEERAAALVFVREQLSAFFDTAAPEIFPVSARDGLQAKLANDPERLAASGIPQLEAKLLAFLLTEKSVQFLLRMCDRTRELLVELPRSNKIDAFVAEIASIAKRIADNQDGIPNEARPPQPEFANLHRLRSCEICAHVAEQVWEFLRRFQYDVVANRDERMLFVNRGGFCPYHTWEYESVASSYGTSAGFHALLDHFADLLHESAGILSARPELLPVRLQAIQPDQHSCMLCETQRRAEAEAISVVAHRLREDEASTLNFLSAICLPHLIMLSASLESTRLTRKLLERQAAIFRRLSEDMRRYALKHDAVRRYLASQEEATAAHRAMLALAGRQSVNFACNIGRSPKAESA